MKRDYKSLILIVFALTALTVNSSSYETKGHSWPDSNSDPFVIIEITENVPNNWTDPIVSAGNSWNDEEEDFTYTFTPEDSENYVTVGSVDGEGDAIAEATVNV